MELKGKAYYCQVLIEAGFEIEMGDQRALSDEELFEKLDALEISFSLPSFHEMAFSCTDPEEIVEELIPEEKDHIRRALVYLLVFEMWRRFVKDKKNLSIFCDELDYTMLLFYEEELGNEAYLEGLIAQLEGILDEAVDSHANPQMALKAISTFFTFPLEIFLYDYIAFQLEEANDTYASKLLDGFYAYLTDPRWFDLLRVIMAGDLEAMYERFIESLLENPDFGLCLETMHYLMEMEQPHSLAKILEVTLYQIETEEDIQDVVSLVGDYLKSLPPKDSLEIVANLPKPFQELFKQQ